MKLILCPKSCQEQSIEIDRKIDKGEAPYIVSYQGKFYVICLGDMEIIDLMSDASAVIYIEADVLIIPSSCD